MSPEPPPRLRLNSPGDVAQLVPYLIGFTPQESLAVMVTEQSRVVVTARADIAHVQPPGEVEHLVDRIWGRFPDADAFVVAYTDNPDQGWALVQRFRDQLPPGAASQAMLVAGDTWYTEDGASGAVDRFGPVATEAAYVGMGKRNSRADLEATFASPPPSAELDEKVEAGVDKLPGPGDISGIVARTLALVGQYLPQPAGGDRNPAVGSMPVEDAAQLALLALTPAGRDAALLSITKTDAESHLEVWRGVVNAVPDSYAEGAAFLAGMAGWVSGDGATANVALERSVAIAGRTGADPLAGLLDSVIDNVVPPTAWEPMRADILRMADPQVRAALQPAVGVTGPWERIQPPTTRPAPDQPGSQPPSRGIGI